QLAQDRSSPRGPLCRYPPCCSERKVRWAAAALSQVQQRAGQPLRRECCCFGGGDSSSRGDEPPTRVRTRGHDRARRGSAGLEGEMKRLLTTSGGKLREETRGGVVVRPRFGDRWSDVGNRAGAVGHDHETAERFLLKGHAHGDIPTRGRRRDGLPRAGASARGAARQGTRRAATCPERA